ncbi:Hint domain-containing protein [Methylobacterium terricola]|uniref:Hint domain-containing protein n=1 Tax=Methylobacterium terricola TaxID=2583531 RepID=UPI00148740C0|nr:Hint domain-containing protein [Methylobacterium terricola]
MAVTFDNTIFGANQAETGTILAGSFTGLSLLSGVAPVTINGTIDQPNSQVTVNLDAAGLTATGATGTYAGFSQIPNSTDYLYYFNVNGGGLALPVTIGVTGGALPGLTVGAAVDSSNVTAPVGPNTPCFVTGTLIRTAGGEVPVEQLSVGDLVVTASGAQVPIRWIGHRRVACDRHRDPHAVWPVRILAGAFGDGLPLRDLWLSPDHAVCLDDAALIPVKHLVNGATVAQVPQNAVTYWHVELASHDILLAEGLPAESFLDTGIRAGFENGGAVIALHPDFAPRTHADFCRPLVQGGAFVAEIRARLAARAAVLGWTVTRDPDLHLVADGAVIRPVSTGDGAEFRIPAETRELRLVSRSFSPYLRDPATGDRRRLGVPVRGLSLRDAAGFARTVAVEDAALATGFSFVQGQAEDRWRWTDGDAVLPAALWAGAQGEVSLAVALVPASHWAGDGVYAFAAPAVARQAQAA